MGPRGTIFAGLSPDTGKKMYAMPDDFPMYTALDSPLTYTFNEAQRNADVANAQNFYGREDWRVPTKAELNVLFNNRAAIGGFNESGSNPAGWYWSSSSSSLYSELGWGQRFSDGRPEIAEKVFSSSVCLVRG